MPPTQKDFKPPIFFISKNHQTSQLKNTIGIFEDLMKIKIKTPQDFKTLVFFTLKSQRTSQPKMAMKLFKKKYLQMIFLRPILERKKIHQMLAYPIG